MTGLGDAGADFRESVRAFVRARSPESEVRRLMATDRGYDSDVWADIAGQLELPGLTVPEAFGGTGSTLDAHAIVLEEMGWALMCAPYLSNVLATEAILAGADARAQADLLPGIVAGSTRGALALTDDGSWELEAVRTGAVADGDSCRLDGVKSFVVDGHTADVLVVAARTDAGLGLFAVRANQDGVHRHVLSTLDPTRKQARVTLCGARGRPLCGAGESGERVLTTVMARAAALVASEAVGGATACLQLSVQYAKDRVQFGRQIGAFQAIKHKCAEMLRRTEMARAAAGEAVLALVAASDTAPMLASVAKAYCTEAFRWVAGETIQVHGGIGYTWEHPAHLHLRRASSSEQLFGGTRAHRERVLCEMGLELRQP